MKAAHLTNDCLHCILVSFENLDMVKIRPFTICVQARSASNVIFLAQSPYVSASDR